MNMNDLFEKGIGVVPPHGGNDLPFIKARPHMTHLILWAVALVLGLGLVVRAAETSPTPADQLEHSQTGTRVQITCIKDNDAQTSIRVAVTQQKRKKLLQTEPWSDPKVNDEASSKTANDLKAAIRL